MKNAAPGRFESPLSIAIIGLGGIGSTFAYQLSRAGHDVTVIARPGSKRLQQLQRDNGIVHQNGDRVEVRVLDMLDEQRVYDLLVVTTLAYQVEAILPALQRSKARCIHFMFNTFNPEHLRDAIGENRSTFGMPFVMGMLDKEGKLNSTIDPNRKTLHSDQRWVDLFLAAGISSSLETNMPLWLRCHVPMCIAMESISIAGQRRGSGASWVESMTVARGLHGGFAIIKGLGYRLYPSPKLILYFSPRVVIACILWTVSRIKSFRELLATGVIECRSLVDVIIAAATEAKQTIPAGSVSDVLAMRPKL